VFFPGVCGSLFGLFVLLELVIFWGNLGNIEYFMRFISFVKYWFHWQSEINSKIYVNMLGWHYYYDVICYIKIKQTNIINLISYYYGNY